MKFMIISEWGDQIHSNGTPFYDNEGAHIAAENIIMDLLYDLGYDDVVDKFEELVDKIGFGMLDNLGGKH